VKFTSLYTDRSLASLASSYSAIYRYGYHWLHDRGHTFPPLAVFLTGISFSYFAKSYLFKGTVSATLTKVSVFTIGVYSAAGIRVYLTLQTKNKKQYHSYPKIVENLRIG